MAERRWPSFHFSLDDRGWVVTCSRCAATRSERWQEGSANGALAAYYQQAGQFTEAHRACLPPVEPPHV